MRSISYSFASKLGSLIELYTFINYERMSSKSAMMRSAVKSFATSSTLSEIVTTK